MIAITSFYITLHKLKFTRGTFLSPDHEFRNSQLFLYANGIEVTGEWRKLHNEELSDLYSLPNIVWVVKSRRMRWAGHVARMGEGRGVHRVLVGKPEGKRPLRRPRRRWEDNIKMDLREVGGDCGDWMELAQDRDRWRALVSTVRNIRVPKLRGISLIAAEPVSFS